MFETIALMKPVQLKESSVSDAIDTPKPEVRGNVRKDDKTPHLLLT